jgi:ATP-dependent RNA helicase DeaD
VPEEVGNLMILKGTGIKLSELKSQLSSIEENNALLWAKQIFKTSFQIMKWMRNRKQKIKQFDHLTKDELIENHLANYFIAK